MRRMGRGEYTFVVGKGLALALEKKGPDICLDKVKTREIG
jgi:hypothetical protein